MTAQDILIYCSIFLGLYFSIFVFITFLENRKKISAKPKEYFFPGLSLILPCYNEEKNISKTLESIINVDYPKDKLEVIVVNDGSTDNTFNVANAYSLKDSRIRVINKENGGKHTALNLGIEESNNQYIGTVDCDSYLHRDSLKNMMWHLKDPSVMVVASTVAVYNPKNILEGLQFVEYLIGNFLRKTFSFLDSVSVIPGPLSVYRKEIFDKVGLYSKAHQTEDMEMALRLQRFNYKISHAVDAVVYTNGCRTFRELFLQRLRWRRGFILNILDYKDLLSFKKHGNLAFLLDFNIVGIVIALILFFLAIWNIGALIISKIHQIYLINFDISSIQWPHFDWLLINFSPIVILGIISLIAFIGYVLISRQITGEKKVRYMDLILFITVFPIISGIWWIFTVWSTVRGKEIIWK